MKITHVLMLSVLFLVLFGCSKNAPVDTDYVPVEQPPVETQTVVVPQPSEEAGEEPLEGVVKERQIETGGATEFKDENLTLLSGIECEFGKEGPVNFSFRITNTEKKKWIFNMLSYEQRDTSDTPIVVLNALQITNGQLMESCGARSLAPGSSLTCKFDLQSTSNTLIRKSLRTGETAMGSVNENTLSLRTSSHASELFFLCE